MRKANKVRKKALSTSSIDVDIQLNKSEQKFKYFYFTHDYDNPSLWMFDLIDISYCNLLHPQFKFKILGLGFVIQYKSAKFKRYEEWYRQHSKKVRK